MPEIGQCRLCLQEHSELQGSHFLSKGIYRIVRDAGAKNPDPYLITAGRSVQTSKQLKRPLFCKGCEERLSSGGERWVLGNCRRNDGTFFLASMLASRLPDVESAGNPTKIYYASDIPEIRRSDIAYFAASIFWRGSLYPWNEDGSIPVDLGPFQEGFRRYLMGEAVFPADACLWVAVREGKGADRLTHVPTRVRADGTHAYKFPMPGLAFTLLVSRNIPARYKNICFVCNPRNPLIVTSILEELLLRDAAKLLKARRMHARRACGCQTSSRGESQTTRLPPHRDSSKDWNLVAAAPN